VDEPVLIDVIPARYRIDYEAALTAAPESATMAYLREHLPFRWREMYLATVARPTNLVRLRFRTFEYLCDVYSELEATGEVAFDQTVQNRVVGVIGTSARVGEPRDAIRLLDGTEPGEPNFLTERDNGHFMAHCIGGGLDVNVFSQDRNLNRGRSEQGKIYRKMERYCYEQPGTLCFSRPIYADGSSVPRWLEFGLLRADGTLWVEQFEN
jgi:hypothetical protein